MNNELKVVENSVYVIVQPYTEDMSHWTIKGIVSLTKGKSNYALASVFPLKYLSITFNLPESKLLKWIKFPSGDATLSEKITQVEQIPSKGRQYVWENLSSGVVIRP